MIRHGNLLINIDPEADGNIQGRQVTDGINISLPSDPVSPIANTLRIEFEKSK